MVPKTNSAFWQTSLDQKWGNEIGFLYKKVILIKLKY